MTTSPLCDRPYRVVDANGQDWPNLVGVFHREFPIAVHQAQLTGSATVTYYGESFSLECSEVAKR